MQRLRRRPPLTKLAMLYWGKYAVIPRGLAWLSIRTLFPLLLPKNVPEAKKRRFIASGSSPLAIMRGWCQRISPSSSPTKSNHISMSPTKSRGIFCKVIELRWILPNGSKISRQLLSWRLRSKPMPRLTNLRANVKMKSRGRPSQKKKESV